MLQHLEDGSPKQSIDMIDRRSDVRPFRFAECREEIETTFIARNDDVVRFPG